MFAAGKSGGVTTPTDPQFNYVTMLLHGDGTNGGQNNTFVDSSTNNFSITRNGNTTQGSFSPYGLLWSNYFDGSGDYLELGANSAWNFSSGDWTIEGWVYPNTVSGGQILFENTTNGEAGISIQLNGAAFLVYINSAAINTGTFTANTWNHWALVRSGSTMTAYINGSSVGTSTTTPGTGAAGLWIGSRSGGTSTLNGYLSNLRVVKGTAVYSGSTFTVPTQNLTAISGTALLTCQSNRFIDNSSNNFTITRNGDVRVTNFAPFAPSAAYSTATNGGSGYFDGSGDYLGLPSSTAFTFGTGDFTVEFWGYFTSTPNCHFISLNDGVGTDAPTGYYYLSYESNQFFSYGGNGGQGIFTSYTMPLNSWVHIVACRSGTTHSIFVNGTRIVTGSTSYSYTSGTNPTVGKGGPPSGSVTGYMAGVRIVKGTAVYDPSQSTITVPTTPLTAITNTSLLLNFTNAAIFDNSMKNDLETVGNAQISTSVVKYGTGSIYLDGSGDWLAGPPTPETDLGSGDFTIEAWLYRTASGAASDSGIVSRGAPSTLNGFVFGYTSSNVLTFNFNYSGAIVTGATTISANTWTHVAVSRSGNTFRLFVNGVVDATATSTNSQTTNAGDVVYVGRSGYDSGRIVTGYLDDVRLTKGYARYTANFTPPTAAFPNQ